MYPAKQEGDDEDGEEEASEPELSLRHDALRSAPRSYPEQNRRSRWRRRRGPDHGQAGGEGAETRLELGNKDGQRKLLQP